MEEQKADEKSEKSCCGKKGCCGCKALAAVALLAVGAVGGYLGGRHCAARQTPAAVNTPANPTK